jgi:hypothetical protein
MSIYLAQKTKCSNIIDTCTAPINNLENQVDEIKKDDKSLTKDLPEMN